MQNILYPCHTMELFIGQQLFLFKVIFLRRRKIPLDPSHKLPCHIPCHICQHNVHRLGFHIHHAAYGIYDQLLLKYQEKFPSSVLPGTVNEAAADFVPELFAVIAVADQTGIQLKHAVQQAGNCLSHHRLFFLRKKMLPLPYRIPVYDHMILDQCMPHQPSRAHAKEMVNGAFRIVCLFQLFFQGV